MFSTTKLETIPLVLRLVCLLAHNERVRHSNHFLSFNFHGYSLNVSLHVIMRGFIYLSVYFYACNVLRGSLVHSYGISPKLIFIFFPFFLISSSHGWLIWGLCSLYLSLFILPLGFPLIWVLILRRYSLGTPPRLILLVYFSSGGTLLLGDTFSWFKFLYILTCVIHPQF